MAKDRTLREMKEAAKDQTANIQMLEQQLNGAGGGAPAGYCLKGTALGLTQGCSLSWAGHDASMMDIEGGRAALQMELSSLRHTVRSQEMEVADLRRELAEAQAGLAAALLRAGVAEREATPRPAATTPVKEDTPEPEYEEADDDLAQEDDELTQVGEDGWSGYDFGWHVGPTAAESESSLHPNPCRRRRVRRSWAWSTCASACP